MAIPATAAKFHSTSFELRADTSSASNRLVDFSIDVSDAHEIHRDLKLALSLHDLDRVIASLQGVVEVIDSMQQGDN
jgi:hypothetical protein